MGLLIHSHVFGDKGVADKARVGMIVSSISHYYRLAALICDNWGVAAILHDLPVAIACTGALFGAARLGRIWPGVCEDTMSSDGGDKHGKARGAKSSGKKRHGEWRRRGPLCRAFACVWITWSEDEVAGSDRVLIYKFGEYLNCAPEEQMTTVRSCLRRLTAGRRGTCYTARRMKAVDVLGGSKERGGAPRLAPFLTDTNIIPCTTTTTYSKSAVLCASLLWLWTRCLAVQARERTLKFCPNPIYILFEDEKDTWPLFVVTQNPGSPINKKLIV